MVDNNKESQDYSEWFKKIKQASNPKSEEEVEGEVTAKESGGQENNKHNKIGVWDLIVPALLFAISLAPRLYYIFYIGNPQNAGIGWYNDSYHHWQIAYLSKEIGFSHGFLRLWDLTGMEYFWGLLQPLLLVNLFSLFQTADIMVIRLLNAFLGSLTMLFLFLQVKRHFNTQAAIAASLLMIFNPVGIFTDVSGMQEPLAIFMMVLGLYFWPKSPFFTAFFWFLASISRAEFWLFSLGLLTVLLISQKTTADKKIILAISYFALIFIYLKYLLDKTGNAIYPLYWNFIGNAKGEWQADIPLTSPQEQVRIIYVAILLISLVVALFLVMRKPKFYLFSLLGVGNLIFLSAFIGLTAYLRSYLPRFWVDRIFWLSYIWLGFILAVILLYYLPRKIGVIGKVFSWLVIIAILGAEQLLWQPIKIYSAQGNEILLEKTNVARQIAVYYQEGSILVPGNDQILTYELYKNGIKGRAIRGQMFDPYFYLADSDPYENWGKNRKVVLNWLKKENIKLILIDADGERYKKLIAREKGMFDYLGQAGKLEAYKVNE